MKKVSITSLGCSKNLIDSEQMTEVLRQRGYEFMENEADADIMIVNTCVFIEDAQTESINCILELAACKKEDKSKKLIVCGCLAQRYKEQVIREIPEVDAVIGVNEFDKIADILDALPAGGDSVHCSEKPLLCEAGRVRTTPEYTAYLKIAEGCDNRCTYCVIPSIRGAYRSRTIENIVSEAREMASEGVKELIVIAQDTTRYGIDIYGEYRLPELLRQLCAVEGITWVRVHYCYPELISDELIEVFRTEPKLCNYLDIPVQHASDRVLKRMGRRTNRAQITDMIKRFRERVPDVVLRTSIIVGFPGETEEDFDELLDFIDEVRFDRLGVFKYSREEDTPAYSLPDQIDEEEKTKRLEAVLVAQAEIDDENNSRRCGSVQTVLVEGRDELAESYYGRTYADSVDIDGKVFFTSDRKLSAGDFVDVELCEAMDMDFFGKAVPMPERSVLNEFTE
ncbi:MAG TPA: 30S ribosomal protein S12 methylthiotransferase RimO [Candidatus Monoglobus merdigallinarum]|uniref:Ribosomal protein uS12 methylthiotransferase RimO n=1 Tax=Candidatus Monoglobus merdigallinarum TaxID=2838698 RepID=A0A9D1PQV7_9FIRM|nr:30S ribosomal protein S12 methylthiotransferase RimO [Candidatus Monoglobus merdigallinarum]